MEIKNRLLTLLRWSERYTKTDMVYLASGGFWTGVSTASATVLSLLVTIVLANFIPKDTYGIYRYILSVIAILSIAALPGLNIAYVQTVARGSHESLSKTALVKIVWGLLGSVGALAVSAYYLFQGNIVYASVFLLAAFLFPVMEGLSLFDAPLQAKGKFKESAFYTTVATTVASALLVAGIIFSPNIFFLTALYFVSWIVGRGVVFFLVQRKYTHDWEALSPEVVGYGKHLTVMRILSSISEQLDKILIYHFVGPVQLAVYSFALVPVDKLRGLFRNISTVLLPQFSRTSGKNTAVGQQTFLFMILMAGVALLYVIAAPYLFEALFPAYTDSIFYSWLYAPALIFSGWIPNTFLTAYGAIKEKYLVGIFTGVVKIVLLVVLGYVYGILGIIAAILITDLFNLVYSLYLSKRLQTQD